MIVTSVAVRNYRALENLHVDLVGMTVLIGENSAGKSSLLQALAFFFDGSSLPLEDVCSRAPAGPVSVSVTFGDLNNADRAALGPFAASETATLTKTWSEAEGVRLRGRARQFPRFREVREADGFPARRTVYNAIREELGLSAIRSGPELEAAMAAYEQAHPEGLREDEVAVPTAAVELLRARFRFVHVPAVRDATLEAREAKGTLLGRILSALAEQRADAARQIAALTEEVRSQYEQRVAEAHGESLARIGDRVAEQLRNFLPDASVELYPQPVSFALPAPQVLLRGGQGDELTDIGRQGHGFQRTFLIATLQLIPMLESADETTFTLFLAIEEPELFQHPSRVRHLARVLDELALQQGQGVQICVTTHSPYLIDGHRYERLRLFRRGGAGEPLRTCAFATEQDVGRRLELGPDAIRARLGRTMDVRFNEAFFARAVILVEGSSDAGAILGTAERMKVDLDRLGIVLLASGGKPTIPVRWAVLDALDVPIFIVFDGDRGGAASERERRISLNVQIQKLLGVAEPVPEPSNTAADRFVCFEEKIERYVESQRPGFTKHCEEHASAIVFGPKSLETYQSVVATLDPVPLLEHVVRRAVVLAGWTEQDAQIA